ncbi:MAG: glycosyltransferase family 4 protein [Acidobacteriota bacterium]|nr:glycosyltransferase family 4 protein [Acidobacteriota bacterium]
MKLAIVAQRYGADINGGAELHARYVAEHLARHADVEVLTTCARDYVTWRNELPAGAERINGLTVRRFPVDHERSPEVFGRWSARVFDRAHSLADELAWLEAEGPASRALIRHVEEHRERYDFFIFFSFRYYHAYHGCRAVPARAVLVPTAERDPAVGVSLFGPVFRGVRALMYNSPEEQALIQAVAHNQDVPGVIVGVGSEIPASPDAARFRQKFKLPGRFMLYVGRIDENKGCGELFQFFRTYLRQMASRLTLVLIGRSILPIPDHPQIRHLGFLDDADKFDALAAADLLIMPSYYESLSMVSLEAWALGRPVLANGRCQVLQGQCVRSNAGLYYESYAEFAATLRALEADTRLRAALGANGRAFFRQHYDWPVIERKYLDMLHQLAEADRAGVTHPAIAPLPGWVARRRHDVPAASAVLAQAAETEAALTAPHRAAAPATEARA